MEGIRCRSWEADHLRIVEMAWYEGPTGLIFVKPFDEPMLQRSGAVTAAVEGQGGSTGDTHQAKVAEDQPDPCNVVCLDCDKTIFVNVSKRCFSH